VRGTAAEAEEMVLAFPDAVLILILEAPNRRRRNGARMGVSSSGHVSSLCKGIVLCFLYFYSNLLVLSFLNTYVSDLVCTYR
jgi:hypothetical protein